MNIKHFWIFASTLPQIFEKYRKINCLKKVTSQRNISSTNKQTREAKRCSKNELKKEIKLPNFAMNNIVN